MRSLAAIGVWAAVALASSRAYAAELQIQRTGQGAAVTVDGKPFAEYRTHSGHQPVIWPIVGPGGQAMTRQYPLAEKLPTERDDHPHHRSLWFNHGLVNGFDFWMEPPPAGQGGKQNNIEHREFAELKSHGRSARIVTRNDWTTDGEKVCEDVRAIEFGVDEHGRWIDFAVELIASEGELTLGDTKEGSFGIRVPGTMDVDAKLGGRILNSRGQTDGEAWGRSAEWVDYRGPVEGQPAGITIFDMPGSFRHPCRWHVRTYGLFAANPVGEHDFPPGDGKQGAVTLAMGETLRLHYRVLFTSGDRSADELNKIYRQYKQD